MGLPWLKTVAQQRGQAAEQRARQHLEAAGMRCLAQNYRCKMGEIDLIMQANDGTVVFVEVRSRSRAEFGDASASVTAHKQRKLIATAQHFLLQYHSLPPCRFDVIALDGGAIQWHCGAFDA